MPAAASSMPAPHWALPGGRGGAHSALQARALHDGRAAPPSASSPSSAPAASASAASAAAELAPHLGRGSRSGRSCRRACRPAAPRPLLAGGAPPPRPHPCSPVLQARLAGLQQRRQCEMLCPSTL